MTSVRQGRFQVGLSLTATYMRTGRAERPPAREVVRRAEEAGLDYLQVGDHVSFIDGTGFDGLVLAATALAQQDTLPVHVGLYLLALRHPVTVARQLADLERLAPGRLVLGIGVGGEDRHEFEICGVDPSTRGRRTDQAMAIVRDLMAGHAVTRTDGFFPMEKAVIVPAPAHPVPLLVGGRSDAALRRTARVGDGWLGLWVSASRFGSAVGTIDELAAEHGRTEVDWRHGLNLWCGVDTAAATGREVLSAAMEERYKLPFDKFERWCPSGSAADVARFIVPYAEAGARAVTLVLHDADPFSAVASAAEVRKEVLARLG